MAGKSEKWIFGTCRDCGKETSRFHEIQTNRKGKIVICHDCMKKYQRSEVASARDS